MRLDNILDPEGFSRAIGRAQLVQAGFDLRQFGFGIIGGINIGAIGRLDPAFQGQRAPAHGVPGISHREPAHGPMRPAGNPKRVAHDDGTPRRGRLIDGRHGAHAMADCGGALGLPADQKTRAIGQIDNG